MSPGYAAPYRPDLDCYWNITVSPGNVIKLEFVDLEVILILVFCLQYGTELRKVSTRSSKFCQTVTFMFFF